MTRLEISVVITTVIIAFIIACPLHCVSRVLSRGFDVIVACSVVRGVVVTSLDTTQDWILVVLVLRLPRNLAGGGEEVSLVVVVVLVLRSGLLQLRSGERWLSLRLRLLGEVNIWDGHYVMRSGPSY